MNTTLAYRYPGAKKIEQLGASEGHRGKEIKTKVNWVSFKQQFFSSVLIAREDFTADAVGFDTKSEGTGEIKISRQPSPYPTTRRRRATRFQYYFGPQPVHHHAVVRHEAGKKSCPLGGSLISWINTGLTINVFNWLSKFISNYGIIILILTVIIKLIILPLTYKSYMSSAKMRVLQPQLNEINERYPNQEDALKKQQAVMELYKKCGVSPMGGCIPMLIQMPILIAMFRFLPASIELRGQHFLWGRGPLFL